MDSFGNAPGVSRAATCFYDYCTRRFKEEDYPAYFTSVEEYLEEWLLDREAWVHCGGDFTLFLAAVAYVFAQWHDRRRLCAEGSVQWDLPIPWRVTHAFKKAAEPSTGIFDALFWVQCGQQAS
jgi:hypothetical protein